MRRLLPHQIVSKLTARLPIAKLSVSDAAELLGTEHPFTDTAVNAELVNRLDGNGILLSLRHTLQIVQIGYSPLCTPVREYDGIDVWRKRGAVALSQWGPMEATLFKCIYIHLRRSGDRLASDILEYTQTKQMTSLSGEAALVWTLTALLHVLVDLASFVHYSTLSTKTSRLRLLATVLSPVIRRVESAWEHAVALDLHPCDFWSVSVLAGRCIRLYGKYFAPLHKMLCVMLFRSAMAMVSSLHEHLNVNGDIFAPQQRVLCMVFEWVYEVAKIVPGLLTHTVASQLYWDGPINEWTHFIPQLALALRTNEIASHPLMDLVRRKEANTHFLEMRECYIAILRGLAVCLAFQRHYTVSTEAPHVNNAFVAMRQVLCLVCHVSMEYTSLSNSNHSHTLTIREWCDCCAATRVIHDMTPPTDPNTWRENALLVWLRQEALSLCQGPPRALWFYATLVEARSLWWRSHGPLCDAVRMSLPRSLNATTFSPHWLITLLGALCDKTDAAEGELRNNCLHHTQAELLLHRPQEASESLIRGLLRLGAAAFTQTATGGNTKSDSTPFSPAMDLFAAFPKLRVALRAQLLPMAEGLCHLFPDDETLTEFVNLGPLLSGGMFWCVCDTCQWALVWRPHTLGASGQCRCVLCPHTPSDAIAECVELFASHFFSPPPSQLARGGPFVEVISPCAALWSIWSHTHVEGPVTDTPAVAFLNACHQQLLRRAQEDVLQPSHVYRILRVVFAASPHLFARVPELPEWLLRVLFTSGDGMGLMGAAELWELCLFVCAVEVARVRRAGSVAAMEWYECQDVMPSTDEDNGPFGFSEGEDVEAMLSVLRVERCDDFNATFVDLRRRILQRALELAS